VCSCVVCSNEYSPGPQHQHTTITKPTHAAVNQPQQPQQPHGDHDTTLVSTGHHSTLVGTKCDNDKCIMCAPIPSSRPVTSSETSINKVPPPPLPKKTMPPYQEYKFGLEEPMPSMVQQQENTAEQSDVRRKKQATKRMEQLIKLHGADEPGLLDDIVPEAGEDHHRLSVNSSSVRTLDRDETGGGQGKGVRRHHKRSILKHHSKESDSSRPGQASSAPPASSGQASKIKSGQIKPNMKVKFAGSLRKHRDQSKLSRRKLLSAAAQHPCQVHFPPVTSWHPHDYVDMRHILAVMDPRYLNQFHK